MEENAWLEETLILISLEEFSNWWTRFNNNSFLFFEKFPINFVGKRCHSFNYI